jgi:hypothetical protein
VGTERLFALEFHAQTANRSARLWQGWRDGLRVTQRWLGLVCAQSWTMRDVWQVALPENHGTTSRRRADPRLGGGRDPISPRQCWCTGVSAINDRGTDLQEQTSKQEEDCKPNGIVVSVQFSSCCFFSQAYIDWHRVPADPTMSSVSESSEDVLGQKACSSFLAVLCAGQASLIVFFLLRALDGSLSRKRTRQDWHRARGWHCRERRALPA